MYVIIYYVVPNMIHDSYVDTVLGIEMIPIVDYLTESSLN